MQQRAYGRVQPQWMSRCSRASSSFSSNVVVHVFVGNVVPYRIVQTVHAPSVQHFRVCRRLQYNVVSLCYLVSDEVPLKFLDASRSSSLQIQHLVFVVGKHDAFSTARLEIASLPLSSLHKSFCASYHKLVVRVSFEAACLHLQQWQYGMQPSSLMFASRTVNLCPKAPYCSLHLRSER